MKIRFFEKKVRSDFTKIISIVSSIISIIFLFSPDICNCIKLWLFIGFLFLIACIYLIVYFYHKKSKKIKLKINNTIVNVFFGNIFEMPGKKVIAFNEYFDTLVDERIITSKSLNGQLVKKLSYQKIDRSINNDKNLVSIEMNEHRPRGKKKKYQLGSIHMIEDYFLLALTHFNEKNEAEIFSNDYAKCLLEMWKQLNNKYAQEEIFIPLLGGGITRILDNRAIEEQELLEIMLNTLEISKLTFKKPSTINIVLYNDEQSYNNYNFARIKQLFK